MMDRQKKDELPKMQMGFIDFVCAPLYQVCSCDLFKRLIPVIYIALCMYNHTPVLIDPTGIGLI